MQRPTLRTATPRLSAFALLLVSLVYGSLRYGDNLGLHAWWQRWLLGLVLSSPFLYLIFTSDLRQRQGPRAG